jgi:hypothetical protein
MNKDLASEIIKVANSLDALGFVKEANSLDNIARKVISQIAIPEPTGKYAEDIQTFKSLLYDKYPNNGSIAMQFSTKVLNNLTPQEKKAWSAQTERIISLQKMSEKERSKINELLYNKVQKYDLDKPSIDENEFEKNWTKSNLSKNLNSPSFDTYNILKSRFRNS